MTLVKDRDFYHELVVLTIPLILQQLLRISVDTVNSIMLGHISQIEMSAVSQANQVFFVYFTLCSGASVGCCVLVSQYWGRKNLDAIRTITAHAVRMIVVLGLAFSAVVMLFPDLFMRIYTSDAQIASLGAGYLRKVAAMYAACGVSLMIFGTCRGIEHVKMILLTNVISYAVNILLDYLLIYGKMGLPAMGITGVAIGTVAARYVELAIAASLFLHDDTLQFHLRDLKRKDKQLGKDLLSVSAPIVTHEFVWSMGTSAGSMITGQLGASVVAGYNVETVLYDLCGAVGNGFSSAVSVVIGRTIGSGDIEKVHKESQTLLVLSVALGVILGLVTQAVKEPFLSMYALEPQALGYAKQFIDVISVIWPFSVLEMIGMIAILRAGGDAKTGLITDIIGMWGICIPLASLAAFHFHAEPVIVVFLIKSAIIIESLVGAVRVLRMKWVRNLTRD